MNGQEIALIVIVVFAVLAVGSGIAGRHAAVASRAESGGQYPDRRMRRNKWATLTAVSALVCAMACLAYALNR